MEDVLSSLWQGLGFHTGNRSQEQTCQPYIEYIKASWTGRGERKDFLRFFVEVVRYFRGTSPFRPLTFLEPMRYMEFSGTGKITPRVLSRCKFILS